jgi:hypothetical protein
MRPGGFVYSGEAGVRRGSCARSRATRMENIAVARSFCSSDRLGVGSSAPILRSEFSSTSSIKRMQMETMGPHCDPEPVRR